MLIALAATAISLVCGVFAGYALSRLKFPFAGSLGTMIFVTYLVPQTLLFIPLADIIRNFHKLGRASCRERVCQYVSISVVAVYLNTKNEQDTISKKHTTIQH